MVKEIQDTRGSHNRVRRLNCPYCQAKKSMIRIFIVRNYTKDNINQYYDYNKRLKIRTNTSKAAFLICRNCGRRTDINYDLLYGNTDRLRRLSFVSPFLENHRLKLNNIQSGKRKRCIYCDNEIKILYYLGDHHARKFFGYFCPSYPTCQTVYFKDVIPGTNWKLTRFSPHQKEGCEPEIVFDSIGGADYDWLYGDEAANITTLELRNLRVPTDPREKTQFMRLFNKLKKYETN